MFIRNNEFLLKKLHSQRNSSFQGVGSECEALFPHRDNLYSSHYNPGPSSLHNLYFKFIIFIQNPKKSFLLNTRVFMLQEFLFVFKFC